ncbi:MAG: signal peptidase I [Acutalibacteraceae bacterium]|jgi:signal peptidase I
MSLSAIKARIDQLLYDMASIIFSAVIIIMIVFTFFFRVAGVVGPSMIPTLHDGDKLLVSPVLKEPARGDIVIIIQPNFLHESLVKRVIAVEGETVDIDFARGLVFVDGKVIQEPYINGKTTDKHDVDFPLTVPEGKVFVLGDNRHHSTDSRTKDIGFVDENYILGKVIGRVFPRDSWEVK